jgi:hypothetical protein
MTKRQRLFFRIGSWACLATAGVHLIGHFATPPSPESDAEATLRKLMVSYRKDFGAGFTRSTMDFVQGFSLSFSLFLLFAGVLGLLLAARAPQDPVLWRGVRLTYAIAMGCLLAISAVYFFLPPLFCVAVIFLAFLIAALAGPEARPAAGEVR